mgnify:CR=1 FL=1
MESSPPDSLAQTGLQPAAGPPLHADVTCETRGPMVRASQSSVSRSSNNGRVPKPPGITKILIGGASSQRAKSGINSQAADGGDDVVAARDGGEDAKRRAVVRAARICPGERFAFGKTPRRPAQSKALRRR